MRKRICMCNRCTIIHSTVAYSPKLLILRQLCCGSFIVSSTTHIIMFAKIVTMSLAACILLPAVLSEFNNPIEIGIGDKDHIPSRYVNNNEDIRYMKNIIDAYRNYWRLATNLEGPNNQDSKYQVWKRNSDIINTLLGIPRRMLEIGR